MVLGIISIGGCCFDHSENRWWFPTLEKSNSCGNMVQYCNNSFSFEVEYKGSQGFQRSSPFSDGVESLIGDALREIFEEDDNRSVELLCSQLDPLAGFQKCLVWVNWHNLGPPSMNLKIDEYLDY